MDLNINISYNPIKNFQLMTYIKILKDPSNKVINTQYVFISLQTYAINAVLIKITLQMSNCL